MEICVTQICVDPPVNAECVIGCSADATVTDVDPDCVIGCSADTTVIIVVDDSCKCIAASEYIGGSITQDCPQIGDTQSYLLTGCNCDGLYCCAGYCITNWIHKPAWVRPDTVQFDGNIMTIGPFKGMGVVKFEIGCLEKPVCEECDPSEVTITITDEVQQYITDCTVDTLLAAAAAKNGTTAPLVTADPGSLSDEEVAALDAAVGESVVDTTTRVASVKIGG